jgi:hypothetical protein
MNSKKINLLLEKVLLILIPFLLSSIPLINLQALSNKGMIGKKLNNKNTTF